MYICIYITATAWPEEVVISVFNAYALAINLNKARWRVGLIAIAMCWTACQLAGSSDGAGVPGELVIPGAALPASHLLSSECRATCVA